MNRNSAGGAEVPQAMTIAERWEDVLDGIECNTEGERCLLLERDIRALAMAVLEDTYHLAGHFRMNPIGTCLCGACKSRARIAALGGKDGT